MLSPILDWWRLETKVAAIGRLEQSEVPDLKHLITSFARNLVAMEKSF